MGRQHIFKGTGNLSRRREAGYGKEEEEWGEMLRKTNP